MVSVFVVAVIRRTGRRHGSPCLEESRRVRWNLNIIVHLQVKSADLKFTVSARSNQTSKHTHALRNEVMLVWDLLRLAPMKKDMYVGGGGGGGGDCILHLFCVIT